MKTVIIIAITDSVVCIIYLYEFLKSINTKFIEYFKYIKKNILITSFLFFIYFLSKIFMAPFFLSDLLNDIFISIMMLLLIFTIYLKEIKIIFYRVLEELFNKKKL